MTTWLSMAIRLVGLLGLLLNAQLVGQVFSTAWTIGMEAITGRSAFGRGQWGSGAEFKVLVLGQSGIYVCIICLCLWLMLRPYKLASRWIRAMEGKCPHCLYPRAADAEGPCSECGLGR
jgi:hypothetical protein